MLKPKFLTIVILTGGFIAPSLQAQTPWATAPAKPAALPAQNSGTQPAGSPSTPTEAGNVRSLSAPPPKSATSPLHTPAFVSLPSTASPSQAVTQPAMPTLTQPPAARPLALPPLPAGPVLATPTQPPRPGGQPLLPSQSPAVSPSVLPGQSNPGTSAGSSAQLVSYSAGGKVEVTELQSGELVAVVGSDPILAGDMSVFVEPIIEQNRARIDSDETERMLRMQLTRQVLKQYITIKAMYLEFFRDMVGSSPPQEIADMRKQVVTRASKIFHEKQVPTIIEKYEVTSIPELERKLAEKSMSLLTMQKQFIEQVLSQEYENGKIPREFEVDHAELLKHYREQGDAWNMPARAKWRQITIRFDKHDRASAKQLIDNLFNQIYLGGKSFEAVARQSSEGYTAAEGGNYDWTTRGSLKSEVLDGAVFTMPVRQLSGVIEDSVGYHIIEITEREDRHVKDFLDAQIEIRKLLSDEKREKARDELRETVLARTPIWTLWPEDLADLPLVYPLADVVDAK